MRLILFDIDGTLMLSGGAGMRALGRALQEVCGVDPIALGVYPDGKTDPTIVREALHLGGVEMGRWRAVEEEVWLRYPAYLEEELARPTTAVRALPGVLHLLERLKPKVSLGVLTGNLEPTARLKLARVQLDPYFPVGAYGSDCAERCRLGRVALERARRHYGHDFEQVWVVGDTEHDIAAARAFEARVLAVGTGRYSVAQLEEFMPDRAVDDLSDWEGMANLLCS